MKKNLCLFAVLLFFSIAVAAQDETEDVLDNTEQQQTTFDSGQYKDNDFRLVYIDHEPDTDIDYLWERLNKLYSDAMECGSYLIVYLADEEDPFISFTNLKVPDGQGKSLNEILDQMNRQFHEVLASYDLVRLQKLVGSDGIFPLFEEREGKEKLNFKSVSLEFYVGPRFWNLGYNEELLAQLFVNLKMDKWLNSSEFPPTKLEFIVKKPKNIQLNYSSGKPFGLKDIGKISEKVRITNY